MSATLPPRLLALAQIASRAGAVVMHHYAAGKAARLKADGSPVTDADQEAEALILDALRQAHPGVPVVAEEEMAAGRKVQAGAHFFLVDPLDGTREFLSRNGEFTVNIAEIRDEVAVAGVVYAPAKGRMFAGALQAGAFETTDDLSKVKIIAARKPSGSSMVALGSRSHQDQETADFLKQFAISQFVSAGSSLKFCLLAAGEADIYVRAGRTMEWDTAAGHALLAAAGGSVQHWGGAPLLYGKPAFENPAFLARGLL